MPFESELNIRLSDLLRDKGIACRPEKSAGRGRRHDIEIKLGSLTAVIEAEKGFDSAAQNRAAKEAAGRVKDGTADIALALCYPNDANEKNLSAANFLWSAIKPSALDAERKWTKGGLDDLAGAVWQLNSELGDPDTLAEQLSNALETAVDALDDGTKRAFAKVLDLPENGKGGINAVAKRAMLVLSTAIMFHSRLDRHLRGNPPETDNRKNPPAPFADDWPPMTAKECAESPSSPEAFRHAWRLILAVDYRPIFETAGKALAGTPSDIGLTRAVSVVARKVLEITAQAASLRHDLLGRIFHRILDSARFDGSFYTSTAAATLLASLALREEDADWKDAKSIGKLKIADPSCGTGTLLMAVAERARDLANRAGGAKDLEKVLIENVLHGYDTNLTATHLAATTLGLLSPGTEFSQMNIERTFLGVDKSGQASLGSLEFIPGGQPSLLGWAGGQQQVDADELAARRQKIPEFDLVIMNPPFTRDSLRHDQFSRKNEAALKAREQSLFRHYLGKNGNGERVLDMSSQANNFVVLAADRLVGKNGAMAAVLPMVTATNPSSRDIRKFIADKFQIETIIVSHDPQRPAFSDSTGISELLLICRRRGRGKIKPARVVALSVNPETPGEALATANRIRRGKSADIVERAITAEEAASGDWTAVQFLARRLFILFCELRDGKWFVSKPLKEFGEFLNGRDVRGAFSVVPHVNCSGAIALWNHNTGFVDKMSARHDSYIDPKPGKEDKASQVWEKRAKLMLPARLGLPQTRAPAVIVARPAVASAWYPFTLFGKLTDGGREIREKAICAYANSSVGILALLGTRDFRILSYPRFSTDSIGRLPVPDFTKLSPKRMAALAAAFDDNAKSELLPLRQMNECETRRAIDHAVADALGIPRELCDEIRELLPKEPSVSGRRYEPLILETKK